MMSEHHPDPSLSEHTICSRTAGSKISRPADGWLRDFRFSPRDIILTSTQKIICQFIACGLSDKEIAYFLNIGCSTVKAHNTKILRTLGLIRRTQLVRFVFETGEFDPEMVEPEVQRRNLIGRKQRKRKSLG